MVWGLYGTFARLGLAVASVSLCLGCGGQAGAASRAEPLRCEPATYSACSIRGDAAHACDGSECTCEAPGFALMACPEQQPCSELQAPAEATGCGSRGYRICPPGAEPPAGSSPGVDGQLWCAP